MKLVIGGIESRRRGGAEILIADLEPRERQTAALHDGMSWVIKVLTP
jgi:hypothetical protein